MRSHLVRASDVLPAVLNNFFKSIEDASTEDQKSQPRFKTVSCSQCGCDFGPGDHGFSHCSDHSNLEGEAQ